MKSKPKILYRPLPTIDETLKSYLLRVAYENGYGSLRMLGHAMNQHLGPALNRQGFPEHKKLLREVRKHLCLTTEELRQCELKNTDLVQNNRHVINISDRNIKACIECLKESPVLNKKWEAAHINHCLAHRCELSHACPNCHKPFTDHTTLFEECSRCGLQWADISMLKVNPPLYQQIDESLAGEYQKLFRAALYQMLVFVTRPLDLHLAVYQRFPQFIVDTSINQYFDYAYSMLVNENFAQSMLGRRRQHCIEQGNLTHLLTSLAYFDNIILKTINSASLFIPHKCFNKVELPESLDNSKYHKNSEQFLEMDHPFKVEHQTIAELLGISALDLNELSDEGVIDGCEFIGVRKHKWFDIRTVDRNLQSIAKHVQYCDISNKQWINLYQLKPTFQRYNLTFAKVLKLIIANELKLVTNVNDWKLTDFKVCRVEIISFLEKHFITTLSGPIKKRDLLNYFQFDGKQFEAFKSLFSDQLIFESCSFGYIPGEAIKDFFDNFILLNHKCKTQKANLKKCVSELKVAGLLPINNGATDSQLYIYKKSHHIQAAITAITTKLSLR
ncbi:TniQ family protein [Pseudoalteromonas sp. APC 3694]|uniref:TniQ family protein n=1 Tax=Pseudoalteromonas sp. APC 3694 TaxID=3035202 RepID=UPI0025B410A8|nr:TniQ family protein [Pseudoalteromonas sp. APC 3694]MDN3490741.1 TniQ family protein [Pseudoalteromonas sp. APC 3694]